MTLTLLAQVVMLESDENLNGLGRRRLELPLVINIDRVWLAHFLRPSQTGMMDMQLPAFVVGTQLC